MADITLIDPELSLLRNNKTSGFKYRERRQDDWTENYTLYRDKVTVNRLTQRQSVNIPLMKMVLKTVLKDTDDMPVIYFQNLDNDGQAQVFQNEYWKKTLELNNAELFDIVDKKQDLFFGRTFDQIQIVDGKIKMNVIDPEDMLVDRYMDPINIDSSRFLIHTHIFVPLVTLENNPDYDQAKVKELKLWHASDQGLLKAKTNEESLQKKNQKMSDMGLTDVDSPVLGETYIELSMHFVYRQEKGDSEEQLYLYVEADDYVILMKKPLDEVIGKTEDNYWKNHYPYNTWADDVDKQDFWSDGIADIVRTPNKVLNAWFSQLVENRTLRNLGMHYYNSSIEGFTPQTFTPIAWGWYPIPAGQGKIDDIIKKVDIPDLSESIDEMNYVVEMVEKGTGATSTQQGVQTERQITLGEVQLALGEAKERVKGMSKFYTNVWKQRAEKFLKLIEAAPDKLDAVKIYKKGRNSDKMYTREIEPKDWMTKSGYTTKVWSQEDKVNQDTKRLEKLNAVKMNMFDNPVVNDEYQRGLLEFAEFAPDKINEAMEYEKQKQQMMLMAGQPMGQPMGQQTPGQPQQQPQQQPVNNLQQTK